MQRNNAACYRLVINKVATMAANVSYCGKFLLTTGVQLQATEDGQLTQLTRDTAPDRQEHVG
jgi:hypothetical protein